MQVWDIVEETLLFTGEHPGGVLAAGWREDNGRFFTVGGDGKLRLWDAASGELVADIGVEGTAVTAAAWGGERLLLGMEDGRVQTHFGETAVLIDFACAAASRSFSETEWARYFPGLVYRETCP
jgi:WD40 repeat protein